MFKLPVTMNRAILEFSSAYDVLPSETTWLGALDCNKKAAVRQEDPAWDMNTAACVSHRPCPIAAALPMRAWSNHNGLATRPEL
jgi:hypothetical protein